MTTVRDMIADALREIGVVSLDEEMDADTAAAGLRAFNGMLSGWAADGWISSHAAAVLSDRYDGRDQDRDAVVYNLAMRLSAPFARKVSPTTAIEARRSLVRLKARFWDENAAQADFDPAMSPRWRSHLR